MNIKDKRGVFGLTAIQQFFAIILGLALLAYVIVIIMGSLSNSSIIPQLASSATENNKYVNSTGYTLGQSTLAGFKLGTITIINATSGATVSSSAYTTTNNIIYNATATTYPNVNITYAYSYDSQHQGDVNSILGNTSAGISGFFSSISPVYAILAVLVIILVLVVLVRIVQRPQESSTPQL